MHHLWNTFQSFFDPHKVAKNKKIKSIRNYEQTVKEVIKRGNFFLKHFLYLYLFYILSGSVNNHPYYSPRRKVPQ
jgi:hypothetical protein